MKEGRKRKKEGEGREGGEGGRGKGRERLYGFPFAAITKYHRFNGRKSHTFVILLEAKSPKWFSQG